MDTSSPCVPTSDQPPKPEWTCHFWYVLRSWALQARPDISAHDAAQLVALFSNLAAGLPCAVCKAHYTENLKTSPYTLQHAHDCAKGMDWIADLRQRIREQITADAAAPPALMPATTKHRSCLPAKPNAAYPRMATAAARAEAQAHTAAIARTALNHAKGDCGCSAKEAPLAAPTF